MGIRLRSALAVATALAAVTLFVGWRSMSAHSMAGVRIEPGAPTCSGVGVEVDRSGDHFRPMIPLRPGMSCQIPYWVVNPGDRDVTVTGLTYPVGGPGARAEWKVVPVEYRRPDPSSDLDAVWTGSVEVEAGGETAIVVAVKYRPKGCTDQGRMWVWPTFTVRSLGRERTVEAPPAPTFRGTRTCIL
ncbi:hypothetical protein [Nocardioides sp. YIM 152588]|uniref:hypothetical protein n=1 Tax=Nocardioides sp. YIM 152588 TaxID=3158259 RepID=UPI0032E52E67